MGYSKSTDRVRKLMPYLAPLLEGKECAWKVQPGSDPERVAYRIREALHIAADNAKLFPELALAHSKYKVGLDRGMVVARLVTANQVEQVPLERGIPQVVEPPSRSLPTLDVFLQTKDVANFSSLLEGPKTATEIVDIWRKIEPNQPVNFPEANMPYRELYLLYKWAGLAQPRLMLMVEGASVTVAPYDADVAEYAWSPDDGKDTTS